MKKIVISIIVFLFTATVTSYAGIFTNNKESTSQSGGLFGNSSSDISEDNNGFGALFNVPSNGPGGRPDSGDGIGQDAPLGDGLLVLTACCVALAVVKKYNGKRVKN